MGEEGVLTDRVAIQGASGGEVGVSFRSGWVRHLRLVLSSAGGAAIVLGLFSLIRQQPAGSFQLLIAWGPWPVIGLVGLAILGKFLQRIADSIQSAFTAVVESSQLGAEAQGKTADALAQLAEQGGRHYQEVQRLAIYAAQEMSHISERMDDQDEMLRSIASNLKGDRNGQQH
jgi:hypothetical protein